jgi:hypothetical protein
MHCERRVGYYIYRQIISILLLNAKNRYCVYNTILSILLLNAILSILLLNAIKSVSTAPGHMSNSPTSFDSPRS